jgi:hypothetical protein
MDEQVAYISAMDQMISTPCGSSGCNFETSLVQKRLNGVKATAFAVDNEIKPDLTGYPDPHTGGRRVHVPNNW